MNLFLSFLLATTSTDAGTGFSDELYSKCPQATQPATRTLSGDWLLPAPRAERLACLLETCETRRIQYVQSDTPPPAWWAVLLVGVSSALGGFFLARAIAELRK